MRVLMVNDLPPGPGGGVEVHLDRLVRGLRAAGDEVELFAGEVQHRGAAKVLDVWDPVARRRFARCAAAFRPDVVHHHHVVRELSVSVLGVPKGVPQVLTSHDFRLLGPPDSAGGLLGAAQRAKSVFDRAVARRTLDAVVGVSDPMARALRDAGFERVTHLSYFADPFTENPKPSSSKVVAFAGRLAADKGVDVLAAAWPRVRAAHPDARLVLAGVGPLDSALAALEGAELLGLQDEPGVRDLFTSARVVVVPSVAFRRPEGTPLVSIEASLAGRALVVSDDPGLRALVETSQGGIVVPSGDVDALAAAVDRILADDELADRLGAASLAHARTAHTTEVGVAAVRALYAEVSANR